MAVGASRGARGVVLKRVRPTGPRTSRRRNGLDDGERKRKSQSDPGQHGYSPRVEARSGFCGLDRGTQRLFRARIRIGFARHKPSCALRGVQFTSLLFVSATERASQTRLSMFQIFDLSSTKQDAEGRSHATACAAAIDVLRETGATTERLIALMRLIALIEGHSACIDRCRPRAHASRSLAQGDACSIGSPMQRLDEHHGIVMDWMRCSFEQAV
jgi:hypothetical protein